MKLFISGHKGMVGSALVRRFQGSPGISLVLRSRQELDLSDQAAVTAFYETEKPDAAIIAAGKVGGIYANNTFPAEFIHENLAIATNCIHSAWVSGVRRLLFLGSSCIYPKLAPQPIREDSLLSSALEPTNEAYAIAKIAGVKMAEYYRRQYGVVFHSAMPTNLYGPGDNYHPRNSHVMPALIRRFHEAKMDGLDEVKAWGTGTPRREFMHVDDLANACAFLLQADDPPDLVNVGSGSDVTIRELVELVAAVVGYSGRIIWDESKPDGTPRKLLDTSL
ncbi:MAG: GDP-L-fucose synthase, partial [Verrucomicrobiaceae bacterium]|nr:GDP-L-fucose synthase [Verrucomicrobiaceae bacterium]